MTTKPQRKYEKEKGKFDDETTVEAANGWSEWCDRRAMVGLPQFLKFIGTELQDMEKRKDAAYEERNRLVALLARLFPSGVAKTAIEGWSEDWHNCVYIDLPTGQASWHIHDSQMWMFDGLPQYTKEWDKHSTEQKYDRVGKLARDLGNRVVVNGNLVLTTVAANSMVSNCPEHGRCPTPDTCAFKRSCEHALMQRAVAMNTRYTPEDQEDDGEP